MRIPCARRAAPDRSGTRRPRRSLRGTRRFADCSVGGVSGVRGVGFRLVFALNLRMWNRPAAGVTGDHSRRGLLLRGSVAALVAGGLAWVLGGEVRDRGGLGWGRGVGHRTL